MNTPILTLSLCLLGAALAVLARRIRRATRERAEARGVYLDECGGLFDSVRTARAATGFPRLAGVRGGETFDLQAIPDTLTFRKLPALWALVSLRADLPVQATFDLMVRPTGVEPFSGFHRLPDQIVAPAGFPEDCALRTDDPGGIAFAAVLGRHLDLFEDPLVKELTISPRGVRIVLLAEEADRTRYLLFRDAEMGRSPLSPSRVEPVLNRLSALRADIERMASKPGRNAA